MTSVPEWLGSEFPVLTTASGELIRFYELRPLYHEEMKFKLDNGADALRTLFREKGIDSIVNLRRKNAIKD